MTAYYNEFDPYAAQWLRNLIAKGLIAPGEVDERSIVEVQPDDLKDFTQCHFFAGIGGWSRALRLADWPDDKPVWTGSPPCQPFSAAGKQKGQDDERHLWPAFFELIKARKPSILFGEQVAAAIRFGWLDGVFTDLEGEGYATGAGIIPASAVNAPHQRERLWFVADTKYNGPHGLTLTGSDAAAVHHGTGRQDLSIEPARVSPRRDVSGRTVADTDDAGPQGWLSRWQNPQREVVNGHSGRNGSVGGFWGSSVQIGCPDGKARRIEPSIPLLADGIPARVGRLRAYGNAIVPQVAAEIIKACDDRHFRLAVSDLTDDIFN